MVVVRTIGLISIGVKSQALPRGKVERSMNSSRDFIEIVDLLQLRNSKQS